MNFIEMTIKILHIENHFSNIFNDRPNVYICNDFIIIKTHSFNCWNNKYYGKCYDLITFKKDSHELLDINVVTNDYYVSSNVYTPLDDIIINNFSIIIDMIQNSVKSFIFVRQENTLVFTKIDIDNNTDIKNKYYDLRQILSFGSLLDEKQNNIYVLIKVGKYIYQVNVFDKPNAHKIENNMNLLINEMVTPDKKTQSIYISENIFNIFNIFSKISELVNQNKLIDQTKLLISNINKKYNIVYNNNNHIVGYSMFDNYLLIVYDNESAK